MCVDSSELSIPYGPPITKTVWSCACQNTRSTNHSESSCFHSLISRTLSRSVYFLERISTIWAVSSWMLMWACECFAGRISTHCTNFHNLFWYSCIACAKCLSESLTASIWIIHKKIELNTTVYIYHLKKSKDTKNFDVVKYHCKTYTK